MNRNDCHNQPKADLLKRFNKQIYHLTQFMLKVNLFNVNLFK